MTLLDQIKLIDLLLNTENMTHDQHGTLQDADKFKTFFEILTDKFN